MSETVEHVTPALKRKLALALLGATALVYMLTAPGHLGTVDMRAELAVAQSMVGKGDFTVANSLPYNTVPYVVSPSNGQHYSEHDLGQSLLLVPAALVGRAAGCGDPASCPATAQHDAEFAASFVDGIAAAVAVVLMFLLALDMGASVRPALALALLFGFTTIAWAYAHDAFDVGPTATALLLTLYAVHRGLRRQSMRWVLVGGAAAGAAVALRMPSLICVPIFGVYLIASTWRLGVSVVLKRAAVFGAPIVAVLLVLAWYNWVRFGDPLQFGYSYASDYHGFGSSPQVGVAGLLFSPGRSIFLFSPILVAALVGVPLLWRRHRALTATVVAIIGVNLLFYAAFVDWWGDWSWGPRFLVPMTPFLILPLLPLLQRWRDLPRAARRAIYGLAAAGVVVQFLDISVDFQHQIQLMADAGVQLPTSQWWSPQYSGIWRHGEALLGLLTGSAAYPTSFQFTDLSTAMPLKTALDVWWVDAWTNGVNPLVVITVLTGAVAALAGLALWLWRTVALGLLPVPRTERGRATAAVTAGPQSAGDVLSELVSEIDRLGSRPRRGVVIAATHKASVRDAPPGAFARARRLRRTIDPVRFWRFLALPIGQAPASSVEAQLATALPSERRSRRISVTAWVLVGFAALAVLCTLNLWISPLTRISGEPGAGSFDPFNAAWWLNWTPFAVSHGLSPFTTDYVNYPVGVNLMWNSWMPALGLLLWPITAIGGSVLTDNVLTTASLTLSAFFAFIAIRRYVRNEIAAIIGGLIYGFSPYMLAQGAVHSQQIASAVTIPLVLLLLDELLVRQRLRPWLLGLLVAGLGVLQFFILEEYFLTEILAASVLMVILALSHRDQVRRRLRYVARVLAIASPLMIAAVAYPVVAVQLLGPAGWVGQARDPSTWSTDLLNLVTPTSTQLIAPDWATSVTQQFSGNLPEWDGYLGIGLLVVVLGTLATCWRRPVVRTAALFAGVMTLFSLGPYLHVGGTQLSVPLPWWIPAHIPWIYNIQPNRLMVFVYLALGFIVAVAFERVWRVRRGVLLSGAVAAIALVPLIPRVPLPWQPVSVPSYFTSAAVTEIPADAAVFTVPCPCGFGPDALVWQMATGMRFKLFGSSNTLAPAPPGQDYIGWVAYTVGYYGKPLPPLDASQRAAVIAEFQANNVSAVVLGPTSSPTAVADMTALLGSPPSVRSGVDVWMLTPT